MRKKEELSWEELMLDERKHWIGNFLQKSVRAIYMVQIISRILFWQCGRDTVALSHGGRFGDEDNDRASEYFDWYV